MNLMVARPPATPEAALELAQEQYVYSADIVHWGTKSVDGLATALTTEDGWFFRRG